MRLRTLIQGFAAAGMITAALPAFAQNVDGTTGNPPGTAASRALDRAAGTNTSGAYPAQSDGTPANPAGTAAGRAADRATSGAQRATTRATNHGTATHRSTATHRNTNSANPPGTAASRAADRAAGTNTSGAYPAQSDGTPANPPGTAASRATGTTNR